MSLMALMTTLPPVLSPETTSARSQHQLIRLYIGDVHQPVVDRQSRRQRERTVQYDAIDWSFQRLLIQIPVGRIKGGFGDLQFALQLQQFAQALRFERLVLAPD